MKTRAGISFVLAACLLSGCVTTRTPSQNLASIEDLRAGVMRVHLKVSAATNSINLPLRVYGFPPLLVNRDFTILEELVPIQNDKNELSWTVANPQSDPLRQALLNELQDAGFNSLSFSQLTGMSKNHSALVINAYYSEPWEDPQREDVRLLFVRIVYSTYPADLDPKGRIDLINQEAVCIYKMPADHSAAVRSTFKHLIRNLGFAGEFMTDIQIQ